MYLCDNIKTIAHATCDGSHDEPVTPIPAGGSSTISILGSRTLMEAYSGGGPHGPPWYIPYP